MRPKQQDFLKKYNCSDNDFKSTGLDWDRLMEIYDDFVAKSITFLPTAKDIVGNYSGLFLKLRQSMIL